MIGAIGAVWMARSLTGLLYGVVPIEPVIFGGAAVLVVGVSLLACMVPARRAAAVDPARALR